MCIMMVLTRDIQSVMVSVRIQAEWWYHVLIQYLHHISCLPQQQHLAVMVVSNQDTSVRVSDNDTWFTQLHTMYVILVSCLHLSSPVNHHKLCLTEVTDDIFVIVTLISYPTRPNVTRQLDDSQCLTVMCVAMNLVAFRITYHQITCQSVIIRSVWLIVDLFCVMVIHCDVITDTDPDQRFIGRVTDNQFGWVSIIHQAHSYNLALCSTFMFILVTEWTISCITVHY